MIVRPRLNQDAVIFVGLDAYSRVGGLQAFNRRTINNLAQLSWREPRSVEAYLLADEPHDTPTHLAAEIKGYSGARVAFALHTTRAARRAAVALIGHINLLPVAAAMKLLNPRMKICLFVHGEDAWNGPARPLRRHDRLLLSIVDTVASVSRYTAEVMQREYRVPQDRFFIFPNAVDCLQFAERERATDPHLVLAVTRLSAGDRRKNIDVLIDAIAELKSRGSPARLAVIGDGALRAELEYQVDRLRLRDRVEFLGRVTDAELASMYARAAVFALPSSKEGFGIVYLEAWQRFLPVIGGSEGAAPEVIDHGVDGLIANERDAQQLAGQIEHLLASAELRRKMGSAGNKKVSQCYSNDAARRNLCALLSRMGVDMDGSVIS